MIDKQLKQAILDSGLSQRELSMITGVARLSICRFLADKTSLRLDCAAKLADYFGLELAPRLDTEPSRGKGKK
ncbi:MAG: hypothetical protein BWY09_00510 [Candidatus Hydrogenedentes bacterium ADurb.Bin179]|nr:MAG: hypothetical protein BWY09_00510 [Candidatus Hydrogenedentes bacterium ADurb.Bin179]